MKQEDWNEWYKLTKYHSTADKLLLYLKLQKNMRYSTIQRIVGLGEEDVAKRIEALILDIYKNLNLTGVERKKKKTIIKKRAYSRDYYKKNKNKWKQYYKQYYKEHRTIILSQAKDRYKRKKLQEIRGE